MFQYHPMHNYAYLFNFLLELSFILLFIVFKTFIIIIVCRGGWVGMGECTWCLGGGQSGQFSPSTFVGFWGIELILLGFIKIIFTS